MNVTPIPSVRSAFARPLILAAVLAALPAAAQTNAPGLAAASAAAQAATNAASAITQALPKVTHSGAVTDIDEEPTDDDKKHVHLVIRDDGDTWGDALIPLAGIAGVFGMPVAVVAVIMYFNYRRRRETLATVREFLNKGVPVPPELLAGMRGGNPGGSYIDSLSGTSCDRRRGFQLTFIGLAVAVALYVNDPHATTWCWGLIPLIMGVGYLLSAWVQDRRGSRDQDLPGGPSGL